MIKNFLVIVGLSLILLINVSGAEQRSSSMIKRTISPEKISPTTKPGTTSTIPKTQIPLTKEKALNLISV